MPTPPPPTPTPTKTTTTTTTKTTTKTTTTTTTMTPTTMTTTMHLGLFTHDSVSDRTRGGKIGSKDMINNTASSRAAVEAPWQSP